jgi:hypothetical protein
VVLNRVKPPLALGDFGSVALLRVADPVDFGCERRCELGFLVDGIDYGTS